MHTTNAYAYNSVTQENNQTVNKKHQSINNSFIHSYSFNVQVDITQLQTDREARKEDRIYIYICSSYSN